MDILEGRFMDSRNSWINLKIGLWILGVHGRTWKSELERREKEEADREEAIKLLEVI